MMGYWGLGHMGFGWGFGLYGLACGITILLVWATLVLLIIALAKWIRKH